MTSVVVVGHVEWTDFIRVAHLPRAGGLQQARRMPGGAGGSAVIAASVIADHGGEVSFIGAVGDDAEGRLAVAQMQQRGIRVSVARRDGPTRRATVLLDGSGERSILVSGTRWAAGSDDAVCWEWLREADGAYVTAAGAGGLVRCRAAGVLVATPRVVDESADAASDVTFDALVFSGGDEHEAALARSLASRTRVLVGTDGSRGGSWWGAEQGAWPAVRPAAAVADSYGCGDSFAGGFTFGLADHKPIAQAAAFGALCGAQMLTRTGAP